MNFKVYYSNSTNLSIIIGRFLPVHCAHAWEGWVYFCNWNRLPVINKMYRPSMYNKFYVINSIENEELVSNQELLWDVLKSYSIYWIHATFWSNISPNWIECAFLHFTISLGYTSHPFRTLTICVWQSNAWRWETLP